MTWLIDVLSLFGALGSTIFVLDYLRTADLRLAYSRLTLVMNTSTAGVLWLVLLGHLGVISHGRPFLLAFLTVVVGCIWYQIVLLHRARRAGNFPSDD